MEKLKGKGSDATSMNFLVKKKLLVQRGSKLGGGYDLVQVYVVELMRFKLKISNQNFIFKKIIYLIHEFYIKIILYYT